MFRFWKTQNITFQKTDLKDSHKYLRDFYMTDSSVNLNWHRYSRAQLYRILYRCHFYHTILLHSLFFVIFQLFMLSLMPKTFLKSSISLCFIKIYFSFSNFTLRYQIKKENPVRIINNLVFLSLYWITTFAVKFYTPLILLSSFKALYVKNNVLFHCALNFPNQYLLPYFFRI